ncbi:MAG: hypothetical protein H0X37_02380 [Herpetosiphonaceae bacterium]|nr:hypothetical protein [Herpetosiphonaceae bacterium]
MSSLAFPGVRARAASGSPSGEVTTGVIAPAAIADPQHPPTTSSRTGPVQAVVKGVRRIPVQPFSGPTSGVPVADPTALQASGPGQLKHDFNGVSSLDSEVTNFNAEFEPPDQGLCVGNGFVVEPVNSAFTIYRADGTVVLGALNVNVLFAEGPTEFTSDPRCYFDGPTHTWFAVILFIDSSNTSARTDIAVNHSGDPTTPWTVYHLDATDNGRNGTPSHHGCPCFGDQPLLGIDGQNLYVSTNEFSILGPQFNAAQIYAIAKSELTASQPAHFVHFAKLTVGGTAATIVQPAISHPGADAEYFLNSIDLFGKGDNRVGVWAITNREAVSDGGIPTLSNIVITTESYGPPPGAAQKGSTSQLDSGDDRMQQVQFIQGELWGALGTVVTPRNDPKPRAGIAWFRIQPTIIDDQISGAALVGEGYVAAGGNYLLYPAIQASRSGTVAMVMTLSGHDFYPSAAYVVGSTSQNGFGPIKIAASGTGPYDPSATRWGDYSAAAFDPGGKSIWFATEYIPPVASQTTDGRRNWGTRVFAVDAQQ